jgi:hypothetical protein
VRQLKTREEGTVKGNKLGDQGVLAALLAQVNRVAAAAGETREKVGGGCLSVVLMCRALSLGSMRVGDARKG